LATESQIFAEERSIELPVAFRLLQVHGLDSPTGVKEKPTRVEFGMSKSLAAGVASGDEVAVSQANHPS
jgi:hypothetical protein